MNGLRLITPLVLTHNEEANIDRCLASLTWAERVVVVDSGSDDATREIAQRYANVAWFERRFDSHRAQWAFATQGTGVRTPYALALDADMSVPSQVLAELASAVDDGVDGGVVEFEYRYHGRPLCGSVYPAQLRLFRVERVDVRQEGHSQEFVVHGRVRTLRGRVVHDDRKPLARWLGSQLRYASLEAARIRASRSLRGRDLLRRAGLAAPVVGLVAYVRAGGPLGGGLALRYALERGLFETILALKLLERSGA